ncbi:MAG TPA: hypothetical protein DCE56_06260 [Cyanobacteria bacterium UBA8553]|nr:hypothetical protein [Cyanobacteria bacterium UBA8553]
MGLFGSEPNKLLTTVAAFRIFSQLLYPALYVAQPNISRREMLGFVPPPNLQFELILGRENTL